MSSPKLGLYRNHLTQAAQANLRRKAGGSVESATWLKDHSEIGVALDVSAVGEFDLFEIGGKAEHRLCQFAGSQVQTMDGELVAIPEGLG